MLFYKEKGPVNIWNDNKSQNYIEPMNISLSFDTDWLCI